MKFPLSALALILAVACRGPEFDLVLRGGHVADGTGAPLAHEHSVSQLRRRFCRLTTVEDSSGLVSQT